VGWALGDGEVVSTDVLVDGVPVGRSFRGQWSVSARLDAPSPPTINVANPFEVSPALIQRYDELFPEQFDEPFVHNPVLSRGAEVNNAANWQALTPDERRSAFPTGQHLFECSTPGPFNTAVGFEVGGLGAGSPLWTRLSLEPPSTMVVLPVAGECVEPVDIGVEVGAVCLVTVHTARGTYVSYMRGLIEFIESLGGPKIEGVEVTLGGANDGKPATGEVRSGNVWEFISGLHNAGPKKIEKVLATLSGGQTVDVTAMVVALLGTDTIDVPFPGEPTFGTCPKGAE
jgi:hypothetical protein